MRVDDVVLFPNGAVQKLDPKQLEALDRGEPLVLRQPPTPWPGEVIYQWPS
jgi:hypothetical protein